MEKRTRIRNILTSRSVFVKIYGILSAAAIAMVLFIMMWVNVQNREANQTRVIESQLSRIEVMDAGMTQVLDNTSQMMTRMLWSQDLLYYMLSGGKGDNSLSYRIGNQLNNSLRGESNLLKNVYFCSLTDGKLMRSGSDGYKIQSLEDSPVYLLVRDGLAEEKMFLYREDRSQCVTTYLFHSNARLFLVQVFRLGTDPLSIGICEFDHGKLAEAISDDVDDPEYAVYLYDRGNHPMFLDLMDYTVMGEFQMKDDSRITRENQAHAVLREGMVYSMRSEVTGVTYLMPVHAGAIGVSLADTLKGSLPAILILLLVVVGVNIYVVHALYQPIVKLVESVSDTGDSEARRGQEFQYLENVYQEARNKEQEMKSTIDTLAPDLFEATLRKLLQGKVYRRSELLEILAGFHSAISVDGRFVVCTCRIEEPQNRQVSEREWNLYSSSLQTQIQEMEGRQAAVYSLRLERNQLVVLLMYSQDSSAVKIKRECHDLCQYLRKKAEPMPYSLYAECGQIYNCMTNIHESYLESMDRIRYIREQEGHAGQTGQTGQTGMTVSSQHDEAAMRQEGTVSAKASESAVEIFDEQEERLRLKEQVEEMCRLSLKGARESAMVIHHRICDEILNRCYELSLRRTLYSIYTDVWAEQLAMYPLAEEELDELKKTQNPREIQSHEEEEEQLSQIEEQIQRSCQLLVNYGKTNRYKYVDQARTYMEANYDNSDLSLNIIADHTGISASYLSELFAEVSGVKFSAALAEIRVAHARELLQNTDRSIREIGESCGFNSSQNFIRVFKKISGYTPGQYREMKNHS